MDFQQRRKSIAIAIYVEILHAKEGATSLDVDWEKFKENLKKDKFKPLLIISSDIRVLDRIKYECLTTMNSERFCEIDSVGKLKIVNMAISIGCEVEKRADIVTQAMRTALPSKWFEKVEDNAEQIDELDKK